jgi:hypothetical protein
MSEACTVFSKYMLDFVGIQKVRWDGVRTKRADEYTFYYGNGNETYELGTGFFVHKRIISAFMRVEFF